MRFGTIALFALPLLLAGTASADLQKTCIKSKEDAGRTSEVSHSAHHSSKTHKAHHHKAHKHHKEHKATSTESAKKSHKTSSTGSKKSSTTSGKKSTATGEQKSAATSYKKQEEDKTPSTSSSSTKSASTSTSRADSTISSAAVEAHNAERSKYGESDLEWDDALAKTAATWAAGCVFEHSGSKFGAIGENLAVGAGSGWSDKVEATKQGIKLWADESSKYTGDYSDASGHWTQMVWKDTTKVGCAVQTCAAGTIFDAESSFLVCQYSPQGNILGEVSDARFSALKLMDRRW